MVTRRARGLLLCGAATLSACVSYTPAPLDVAAITAAHDARSIDSAAVRTELARIAPEYVWNEDEWDRVTLLAAALVTNPELARARAALVASRAEAEVARVSPGPTLSLTAEYAFNPTESSPWLYGIASDYLIDRGGRRQGRIETADVAARVALLDYAASVWSVRSAIRRALDARLTWQAEAAVARELVTVRQREFDAVSRRVAAGEISRLELDRVRADVANDARLEADATSNAAGADLDLAAALGIPPAAFELDRIVPRALGVPDAAAAVTETQISNAFGVRPEILQAIAAYDRAEAALRVAVASQYPELRIGPGYTWERGLKKLPFSLSLALPTSDRARASIDAAEARRAEAGRQLEAAVAAVAASIERARADYRAAWTVLDLIRKQTLPTAEALARQADLELEAGSINRADWGAARAGLMAARRDEIVAARAVLEAEAALEDTLHQPIRGPETLLEPAFMLPALSENDP